jgi:hypothetical protein
MDFEEQFQDHFLDHVITGDDDDVSEAKRQPMEWRPKNSPPAKEATDDKVQDQNNVDLLITHFEFVPEDTTVNQTFYAEVL